MRSIEFRVWHKKAKLMLYYDSLSAGNYTQTSKGEHNNQRAMMTWSGAIFNDGKYQNESIEIMQYIGTNDRLGQKIWEGDIVKLIRHKDQPQNFVLGTVHYADGGFYVQQRSHAMYYHDTQEELDKKRKEYNIAVDDDAFWAFKNERNWSDITFYHEEGVDFFWSDLEVLGNIYENIELLPKEEQDRV